MNIGLLIVITILLVVNVITMSYVFFVLKYNKNGLVFLEHVRDQIRLNNEDIEMRTEIHHNISVFIDTVPLLKSRISFLLFILNINVAMLSFAFFPVLLITDAWYTMSIMGAICNACMISILIATLKIKNRIDITCVPYNTLLEAYSYMHFSGEDDDSTG